MGFIKKNMYSFLLGGDCCFLKKKINNFFIFLDYFNILISIIN